MKENERKRESERDTERERERERERENPSSRRRKVSKKSNYFRALLSWDQSVLSWNTAFPIQHFDAVLIQAPPELGREAIISEATINWLKHWLSQFDEKGENFDLISSDSGPKYEIFIWTKFYREFCALRLLQSTPVKKKIIFIQGPIFQSPDKRKSPKIWFIHDCCCLTPRAAVLHVESGCTLSEMVIVVRNGSGDSNWILGEPVFVFSCVNALWGKKKLNLFSLRSE